MPRHFFPINDFKPAFKQPVMPFPGMYLSLCRQLYEPSFYMDKYIYTHVYTYLLITIQFVSTIGGSSGKLLSDIVQVLVRLQLL